MFKKKWVDKIKQIIPKFVRKGYNVNILHNSIILYFILLISIINLISYGLIGNYHVPTFFFLIGIITSYFSKNMTVILTVSLICSNLMKSVRLYEGMEGKNEDVKQEEKDEEEEEKSEKKKEKEEDGDVVKPYEKTKETKVQNEKMEGMQQQYKELMTLQDKILGNIGTLEESLSSAEGLVKKIGNSIEKSNK